MDRKLRKEADGMNQNEQRVTNGDSSAIEAELPEETPRRRLATEVYAVAFFLGVLAGNSFGALTDVDGRMSGRLTLIFGVFAAFGAHFLGKLAPSLHRQPSLTGPWYVALVVVAGMVSAMVEWALAMLPLPEFLADPAILICLVAVIAGGEFTGRRLARKPSSLHHTAAQSFGVCLVSLLTAGLVLSGVIFLLKLPTENIVVQVAFGLVLLLTTMGAVFYADYNARASAQRKGKPGPSRTGVGSLAFLALALSFWIVTSTNNQIQRANRLLDGAKHRLKLAADYDRWADAFHQRGQLEREAELRKQSVTWRQQARETLDELLKKYDDSNAAVTAKGMLEDLD